MCDYFVNKCSKTKKKVVPDFRYGENFHCDREIFLSTLKLRHFFTHNISRNRHMKYNIYT